MVMNSKSVQSVCLLCVVGALVLFALVLAGREWYIAIDKEKVIVNWEDSSRMAVNFKQVLTKLSLSYNEKEEGETLDYLLKTPVDLEGNSLSNLSWLVESTLDSQRFGYDVLYAVVPQDVSRDVIVLVNSGWVSNDYVFGTEQNSSRGEYGSLLQWKVKITQISLNNATASSVVNAHASEMGHFQKIQTIQTAISTLSKHYHQVYYAILLPVIPADDKALFVPQEQYTQTGFLYHFTPLLESPDINRAYALQWLLLALAILLISSFSFSLKKEAVSPATFNR